MCHSSYSCIIVGIWTLGSALINPLALQRSVVIFDNSGVGRSTGTVPNTFAGWSENTIALMAALEIPQIDLLGFSMGGRVAQMVALNAPHLVRRLILAGTRSSIRPDTVGVGWPLLERVTNATTPEEVEAAFTESFFMPSTNGVTQAKSYWQRIHEREHDSLIMDLETTQTQLSGSWIHWETASNHTNSYERLGELKMPVFVANCDTDILVPTANSFVLQKMIQNSYLYIYPDTGHEFLYQHGKLFTAHVGLFWMTSK